MLRLAVPVPREAAGGKQQTLAALWVRSEVGETNTGIGGGEDDDDDSRVAVLMHLPPWLASESALRALFEEVFAPQQQSQHKQKKQKKQSGSVVERVILADGADLRHALGGPSMSAPGLGAGAARVTERFRGHSIGHIVFRDAETRRRVLAGGNSDAAGSAAAAVEPASGNKRDKRKRKQRDAAAAAAEPQVVEISVSQEVADRVYSAAPVPMEEYGVPAWLAEYRSSRLPTEDLMVQVEAFMDSFDARQEQAKVDLERRANKPDADGFIEVLSRGGKRSGTTEASVKAATLSVDELTEMRDRRQQRVAASFYKFQNAREKRDKLAGLRKRFEEDKEKINRMRSQRKFRPY
jgi:Ribosomal RNA-processing protein 7 (RRP7) C-terminal domain